MSLLGKGKKLFNIISSANPLWYRGLKYGVAASVEHLPILQSLDCATIIDIGANRGQFALAAKECFSDPIIISFEPLPGPADIYRDIFLSDNAVTLYESAIGPVKERRNLHVSAHDDSSSLLPITNRQIETFPGTNEIGEVVVQVSPLDYFITENEIVGPAMLKLDVQGFELDALIGCESLFPCFNWIYCECSFIELYEGQKLASEVIAFLYDRGFLIKGIYNTAYNIHGQSIQADFLFCRKL